MPRLPDCAVVELYYAHGLRQSHATLRSTGFDVHQDTEDFDFIEYTVVVKLTPDTLGEPPSAMRVVGASRNFFYGPKAGDAGCFKAKLYHASVEPRSRKEHLKVAFFFRRSEKGERRAKRTAAQALDSVPAEYALAQGRAMVAQDLGRSRQDLMGEVDRTRPRSSSALSRRRLDGSVRTVA